MTKQCAHCGQTWPFQTMNKQLCYCSVQLSLRWYLCTWEGPYVLHPVSAVSSVLLLKWFQYSSDWWWPSLVSFQGRSLSSSSFPASLLQVVDGVMSLALFPPASASSSSTLKIFWDASRLWWLLCLPDCLLGHFPFTSACPGQYIHGSLQVILQEKWDFTKRKVENIEEGEGKKRNEFVFPFRCHSIIQF